MQTAHRELSKATSQFNILNSIRMAGEISRIEIARLTGQSRAAVTNITAKLLDEGMILEKETLATSSRGRRRVMLTLNPNAAYVAGVKLSAFQIIFAVANMRSDLLSSLVIPVRIGERSAEFVADLIEEGIRHCVYQARLNMIDLSGIGIGIPACMESAQGIPYWAPLHKNGDTYLKDRLHERFQINIYVENDANTVTLAQQLFGGGRGVDNFLTVTIDHCVGMGVVLNGQIYRGSHAVAAELGHMVIRPGGELCRCGKRGCVEGYVADYKILEAATNACKTGKWQCGDPTGLTIDDVTNLAKQGEPALQEIFKTGGEILGLSISGLIHLFNPEKIIIAGEGTRAGDLLFDPMRKSIQKHTSPDIYATVDITVQKWRDTDWALGAASLVLQELYKAPDNRSGQTI